MKVRIAASALAPLALASLVWLSAVPSARAQGGNNAARIAKAQAKPTPRMADGHPDLSGFYGVGVAGVNNYGAAPTGTAEAVEAIAKKPKTDSNAAHDDGFIRRPLV